jgi:hypothetical protein
LSPTPADTWMAIGFATPCPHPENTTGLRLPSIPHSLPDKVAHLMHFPT